MTPRFFAVGTAACLILALVGCAKISDKAWRLVSSKVDAVAIVNEQLMQGEAALAPDRTGTVTLNADKGTISSCVGPIRYTSTRGSVVDLRCSDGSAAELQITMLTETHGYGYGQTATGSVSVAFGLDLQDARAYLTVPANKKLVERVPDGVLELQ
jgi:hypothetical protein